MEDRTDQQVVIDQADAVLALLARDVDAAGDMVDAVQIHATLCAVRALLATAKG